MLLVLEETCKLERLGHLPALIWTGFDNWLWKHEALPMNDHVLKLLDREDEDVFYVVDVRSIRASLVDVIFSTNIARYDAILNHPRLRRLLLITDRDMIRAAVESRSADDRLPVSVFGTYEAAIKVVQAES